MTVATLREMKQQLVAIGVQPRMNNEFIGTISPNVLRVLERSHGQ